jgi:hypothetical protein
MAYAYTSISISMYMSSILDHNETHQTVSKGEEGRGVKGI